MNKFIETKDKQGNPMIINADKIIRVKPLGQEASLVLFESVDKTIQINIPYHELAAELGLANVEPADENVNKPARPKVTYRR